jgi:hypothetical protein
MRSRRGTKVPPSGDGGVAAYQALFAQKIAIEAEFGEPLIWEERANTKRSLIYIQPFPVDFGNPAIFQQAHEWMLRRMEQFRAVFGPRVAALVLRSIQPKHRVQSHEG